MAISREGLHLDIPGRGAYHFVNAVVDVNGTVCLDGQLVAGVREALRRLAEKLTVHFVTADTQGTVSKVEQELGIHIQKLSRGIDEAEQKLQIIRQLGAESAVAIGNGTNDAFMLKEAAIGIAVLGKEGLALPALINADIVVPDVLSAIEMLLNPKRLIATLRR